MRERQPSIAQKAEAAFADHSALLQLERVQPELLESSDWHAKRIKAYRKFERLFRKVGQ